MAYFFCYQCFEIEKVADVTNEIQHWHLTNPCRLTKVNSLLEVFELVRKLKEAGIEKK